MTTVTIWSDIHCPWAFVTVHRLRQARSELGLDVDLDPRPWPLEFVNEQGSPRGLVEVEAAVLAQHEPELFSRFQGQSWPASFLPAFELVAAARRFGGVRAAEEVDYHLRLAFFRDSAEVDLRHVLGRVAATALGEDGGARVIEVWERQPVRADVLEDWERSQALPIQGSPQVFWPDGTTTHNPGMTDHTIVRGIPRIHSVDPQAPARLLAERVAAGGAAAEPRDGGA